MALVGNDIRSKVRVGDIDSVVRDSDSNTDTPTGRPSKSGSEVLACRSITLAGIVEVPLLNEKWVAACPWGCAGDVESQEAIFCGAHSAARVRLSNPAPWLRARASATSRTNQNKRHERSNE
jgi:hypothetical protein